MIAAFKSFKHGMFKILCLKFKDAFGKRNPMLTASDYNVVLLFFFRLNFPALEPVGDNSHLCELQNFHRFHSYVITILILITLKNV